MPDLKVKIGLIGKFDMLKFKNMKKVREQAIQAAPANEIKGEFAINKNAKAYHPDFLKLVVDEVIDHGAAASKSFVLKSKDGKALPYFRAGQYISLKLNIEGSEVTRAYSLCSSPKKALGGKYEIAVRANPNGFVADKLLETLKVGDEVIASSPKGNFYYEDLRDGENVVAIAGGAGITPFMAMAQAIADGVEKFNLTIIFNSRTEENILFKKELDAVCAKTNKVKVVHVLSREEKAGFEKGHITAELIKKYAPASFAVYICGPEKMYKSVLNEVKALGVPQRLIRHEALGMTTTVWEEAGYPAECKDKVFELTVKQGANEYKIPCAANEPILVAIERAGIKAPSRCRAGECGWCRSKLLSGTFFVPADKEYRRWSDKENNYVHPCCTFATSDIVLEVPGVYY